MAIPVAGLAVNVQAHDVGLAQDFFERAALGVAARQHVARTSARGSFRLSFESAASGGTRSAPAWDDRRDETSGRKGRRFRGTSHNARGEWSTATSRSRNTKKRSRRRTTG